MSEAYRPKIGLALGSGSARGMAHIGIIDQLEEIGVRPDIICGSSAGSLIGAASVLGKMRELGAWVQQLSTGDILRYMDIRLAASGGFANGQKLMEHLKASLGNPLIENVRPRFAAVATELSSGREIWLQDGSIWDAVRASIALPGMFTPVARQHHWLVDGGLVNPVPVSVCRAMGADIIIAVNLNNHRLGRHSHGQTVQTTPTSDEHAAPGSTPEKTEVDFLNRLSSNIKEKAQPLLDQWLSRNKGAGPAIFDVMASSINIMQDRITRSRLAGEPADILLSPQLAAIGLLQFDRTADCIEEGRACVERHRQEILELTGAARQAATYLRR